MSGIFKKYLKQQNEQRRLNVLFALIALTVNAPALLAQQRHTDAHITGHVIDKSDGDHMPYVTLVIKGTTFGGTTDATGHFLLKNAPVGEHTLVASYIGYEPMEQTVTIIANKTIEVFFELNPQAFEVSEVVVTGSRTETLRRESPMIVNVLSAKTFDLTATANMADALVFLPGLRVETYDRTCGASELKINGLGGQYTQILIDSRPVFSTLAGVYGLEQLPAGMIERLEVIRGGGSALYGSSAIGGVINIITKEPLRNSLNISNNTGIYGNGLKDINTSLNGSFVTDDQKAGVYTYGIVRSRDPYDRIDDGFTDVPKTLSQTIGFRGYYKLSDYSRITAEYHHIHEFRRGGDLLDRPPHETLTTEQLRHYINGGGLKYDLFSADYKHILNIYASMQGISRETYFGTDRDPDAYGNSTDLSFVAGSQYSYSADRFLFMPSQFILGLEYSDNSLEDQMPSYGRYIDQYSRIMGGFVQNEWKNELFSLAVGGRLDKSNRIDGLIFSPRINARYTPVQAVRLRAGYSSGYRVPQVFQEDLHINAIGGTASVIEVDPNLKPEYSHSLNFSIDMSKNFNRVQTNLLIDAFFTKLNDVFVLEENGVDPNNNFMKLLRTNAPGATIGGVNLELRAGLTSRFGAEIGLTLQRSRYVEPFEWSPDVPAEKKMLRSPNHYGYITLNYNPIKRFILSATGNYTGPMLVPHYEGTIGSDELTLTQSFFDAGLRLAYDFQFSPQFNLQISGGIKNIFDQFQKDIDAGNLRDASYVYGPAMPRMVYFGLKVMM